LRHARLEIVNTRPRRYVNAGDVEYQRAFVVPGSDVRCRASASRPSDER
jgi:hypothetical protein